MADNQQDDTCFEVCYRPTSEDVLAYHRYLEESPCEVWRTANFRLFATMLFVLSLPIAIHVVEGASWFSSVALSMIVAPYVVFVGRRLHQVDRARLFRAIKSTAEKQLQASASIEVRLTINRDGVSLATKETRSTVPWTGIVSVGATERHLFLVLRRQVIVVARRLFASGSQFQQCAQCASEAHKQSRAERELQRVG